MAKAKGTTLIGAVKFLRSRRDEAIPLMPPDLVHYLSETIYPATWYPEQDLHALLRVLAKLMPGPDEGTYSLMGAASARDHQEGVYAHLMEGGATPTAAFALWASMHDSGKVVSTREGPGVLVVNLVDFALPCREMCLVFEAYVLETLRMGGATPAAEKLQCVVDGAEHCSWRYSWAVSDA